MTQVFVGVAPATSSSRSRPMRCRSEQTVTTRDRSVVTMRSSSRPVSAKWPRWLVAICSSKPSAVWPVGRAHHAGVVDQDVEPGMGRRGTAPAARRTETRSARSRCEELQRGAVELALELVPGPARLFVVAAGQITCAPWSARARDRLVADAAVGARDQRPPGRSGRRCRRCSRWRRPWPRCRGSGSRVADVVGGDRPELARLEVLEGLDDLRPGVHDERAVGVTRARRSAAPRGPARRAPGDATPASGRPAAPARRRRRGRPAARCANGRRVGPDGARPDRA